MPGIMTILLKYPKEENPKGTRAVALGGGIRTGQRMGPLYEVPVDQQAEPRDSTSPSSAGARSVLAAAEEAPAGTVSPLGMLSVFFAIL